MQPRTPGRLGVDVLLGKLGDEQKGVFFRKNQMIFSQGDRSDSIFYIQKGSVKLTLISRQGKEAVIAILGAGSFFGDSAFASDRPPRPHHAVALMDVRVMRINPNAMLRLIHQDEGVCDAIISSLVSLKTDIIGSYADNLLYFAQQRLARLLLKMGRSDEDPEIGRVPKLRQQDLANMIGVSRQRVNLLLKALKKAGPLIDDSGFRKD